MNMTQTQIKQVGTILLLTPVAAYVTYKLALEVWCIVYGLIY